MQDTPEQPQSAESANHLLAGLSVLTVLNLKHCEDEYINVTHAGPSPDGKYSGWITTLEGRPVINTKALFDTPKEAEGHMRKVIAAARAWEDKPAEPALPAPAPFSEAGQAFLDAFYAGHKAVETMDKIQAIRTHLIKEEVLITHSETPDKELRGLEYFALMHFGFQE